MKIAVICGSNRSGSFNAALTRALPDLAPPDMTFETLTGMEDFPHYNADLQIEGFPERVLDWADRISSADGVIFVTPEYNYSVPGVMKNTIDWLSRLKPGPFEGKPVAIQSCAPGAFGGVRAQVHLRQILLFLDALVLNKPEVFVSFAKTKFSEEGALTDEATRDFVSAQLTAFHAFVGRVAADGQA